MEMVLLRNLKDYESLPLTKWNIRQPPEDDEMREVADASWQLDLVLVPGLAFTTAGERLGRGRGYYDAFLASCSADVAVVALAFDEQMVEQVPAGEKDFRVQRVVSPTRS